MIMELYTLRDIFALSSILLILPFFGWFIFRQIEIHVWKLPPGPIGLPIVGYSPFLSKDVYKDAARLNKIYGKICSLTVATKHFVFVSDYDTAKELLCHPAALSRPEHAFDIFPGKAGFLSMSGKQWVLERRCFMQALRHIGFGKELSNNTIRADVSMIIESIIGQKGIPMCVRSKLCRSGMNNIISLVLGRNHCNKFTDNDFELFSLANDIGKQQFENNFITFVFPWLQKYLFKLNFGGLAKRKELMETVSHIARNEIVKHFNSEDDEDLVDTVKQYEKEVKKHNASAVIRDDCVECLIGNAIAFVNAIDTVMLATQWNLYLMAAYPEIQAKVHAEIDNVIGRNVEISWEDRNKLPYTMACIMEMLRWIVPVPVFLPRCTSDSFEFHGYSIPKGTVIISNGWAFNRDPKYWDQPDEYIPERFMKHSVESYSKLNGYGTFGFGKRNCPGEKYSMFSIYLYFTSIMQKFKVRTPSGEPPDLTPNYNVTLDPKDQDLCFLERE